MVSGVNGQKKLWHTKATESKERLPNHHQDSQSHWKLQENEGWPLENEVYQLRTKVISILFEYYEKLMEILWLKSKINKLITLFRPMSDV